MFDVKYKLINDVRDQSIYPAVPGAAVFDDLTIGGASC